MAQGRYQLGVGISALPTDHDLFALDTSGGVNRRMTFEALEVITQLWRDGASDFDGEFWSMRVPRSNLGLGLRYHLRPYQLPRPPIAIAGMTPGSANHKLAGEKGYLPVSFCISPDANVTARHWEAVMEGAARSGRTPDRGDWRLIRDVYVAPTDREAHALALGGMMGRCWREFLLPLYLRLGLGSLLKGDRSMADEDVDLEYVADNLWLVGSPDTVARGIRELQEHTGGFGYLLITSYDAIDERQSWERSLQLLIDEVLPACDSAGVTAHVPA